MHPDDPFGDLPPELRAMLEQMGGPDALAQMQEQLSALMGSMGTPSAAGFATGAPTGPVDWDLATRVALQVAAEGDRSPTSGEQQAAANALQLAEHWLDDSSLPAPPDAGALVVSSRQTWVNAAITALRPMVEAVATATSDALIELAGQQFQELQEGGEDAMRGLEEMGIPPELGAMVANMMGGDMSQMLRPASAALAGLQAGQVIGQLAQQLLGQYDLGIPTAPRGQAHYLAVNVAESFEGYDLDATEVAVVLALTEAAHRRLYHAVPWLEEHLRSLVAQFAAGTVVDPERLHRMVEDLMVGVDPDDPEELRAAMEKAAGLRLEPTEAQQRILERLQGVVCLVGAWARHEVDRAVADRLPGHGRIQEVLRRRRATRGDGEALLAGLLGLDLKPTDESAGERFVETVGGVLGPEGLHRALAHPENLPDADELEDPGSWLERMDDDTDVPDDASALFGELGDAPVEGSADERTSSRTDEGPADDGPDDGGGAAGAGDDDPQDPTGH
jgi:putative hydrolase